MLLNVMFSQTEHTSQGMWHDFHCSTLEALSLFKGTRRHRTLRSFSRLPAVSDVPLSSGAEGSQGTLILQGGRRGVI